MYKDWGRCGYNKRKNLAYEELYRLAMSIKEATNHRIKVIVSGNYEVGISMNADAIHSNYNDLLSFHKQYQGIKGVFIHTLGKVKIMNEMGINNELDQI